MSKKREPIYAPRLRAMIIAKGSMTSYLYGVVEESLLRRAINNLTRLEPGVLSLFPDRIELQREVPHPIRKQWKTFRVVKYEDIPEDQCTWYKLKQLRKTLIGL